MRQALLPVKTSGRTPDFSTVLVASARRALYHGRGLRETSETSETSETPDRVTKKFGAYKANTGKKTG
jgi:hypothetical protein